MLNRVVLMGRLVRDPELRTTPQGVSVSNFRIAVDRSYIKKGEERQSDFFDIICWRQTAEFASRYFKKGNLIAIDGQLQSRTYQAKDGSNRSVVEVIADNISFTGERTGAPSERSSDTPSTHSTVEDITDDEDPFVWDKQRA